MTLFETPAPVPADGAPAVIVLEVVGVPAPQGSKTRMPNGAMVEGSTAKARAALKAWRGAVAQAARDWLADHPQPPLAEPVRVIVTFRFAPVASDRFRTLHATKPDLDKLARAVFDALVEGGLLADDSRVCSLSCEKVYACVGESVGATVEVERLGWYETEHREVKKAAAAAGRRRGAA